MIHAMAAMAWLLWPKIVDPQNQFSNSTGLDYQKTTPHIHVHVVSQAMFNFTVESF